MIMLLIATLLSLSFTTSCINKPIELSTTLSKNTDNLATDQFIEDYEYMWDMLEENCPLVGLLERTRGDLDNIKEEWLEKVNQCNNQLQFYKTLVEFSDSILYGVGHLNFVDKDGFFHLRDLYNNLSKDYPEGFFAAALELLNDTEVLEAYHYQTMDVESSHSNSQAGSSSAKQTVEYPAENVMMIRIPSFSYSEENGEMLLAAYAEAEEKGIQNLILDITENGGGSEPFWMDYIVCPNLQESVSYSKYSLLPYTEYNRRFWEPYGTENLHPISELPEFSNLNWEDIRICDFYADTTIELSPSQDTPLFSGKIYVLIGPEVFSSSEGFAYFCKETGFATLVGEATGGDGIAYGNPLLFELPNTHYLFRYTGNYGLNSDGSCNAEKGTQPDILCEVGESPLDACLKIVN